MTAPAAAPPPPERIYLRDGEMAALMRDANGPVNGRVVPCAFGGGQVWLDPRSADAQGQYPRWILLRLAVLRGLDLTGNALTPTERAELDVFAAAHGKELKP